MQEMLEYEDGPDDATRVLMPAGELDGSAARNVGRRVEQALAAGKRRVIVDLSHIDYMETSSLAALLDANARVVRFGAALLVVVPADSRVRLLFSITRLDKVLRVLGSRQEALLAS